MEIPPEYLEKLKLCKTKAERVETEYAFYLNVARKITKQPYMVLHRRISAAFGDHTKEYVLSHLKDWVHQAEKSRKDPKMIFNSLFKQFRERKNVSKKEN